MIFDRIWVTAADSAGKNRAKQIKKIKYKVRKLGSDIHIARRMNYNNLMTKYLEN